MHFGATLKLLRTDAGLSLRALARKVGVSSAYLSRVENGRDAAPTPGRLAAIAAALELPPDLLVELADQTGPALSDYLQRVPMASAFFLEVARRELDADQVTRLRAIMDEEFPPLAATEDAASVSGLIGSRIALGVACSDMDAVIAEGAARCVDRGASAGDILRRIGEREAASPTVLGRGIAVPHAIVPGARPTAALVTLAEPLVVPGYDAAPVEVAFVLVSGAPGSEHLETLAKIARLASHGVADELRGVRTPARAAAIIRRLEAS